MIKFGKASQKGSGIVWNGWPHLIVLLFVFFAGVFAGFFLAHLSDSNPLLQNFLNEHFGCASEGDLDVSFVSVLWDCLRWPLAVVVFSFSALGVVIIPALLLARGFLLSYAISCFAVLFHQEGFMVSAALFSVTALLVIPVMFLFGCEGLRSACLRLPGAVPTSSGSVFHLETLLIGLGILAIAVAMHWAVIPAMFSSVCTRLF